MPPFSSTGGDLVDQLREWFDRQWERFAGRGSGAQQRPQPQRVGRRTTGGGRPQAVPLGSSKAAVAGRPGRAPRRNDRAGMGAYTVILGAVLVVGVIALFFVVRWALDSSGSTAAVPTPSASPAPQPPQVAAAPSPPLFPLPSPSPSPTVLAPPQQRVHTIEGGDTLSRIAQRYGVTVEAIMQANGFTDRNRVLRIGDRLVIPDTPTGSPVPIPR